MSDEDRRHWDARFSEGGMAPLGPAIAPLVFASFEDLFPTVDLHEDLTVRSPSRHTRGLTLHI